MIAGVAVNVTESVGLGVTDKVAVSAGVGVRVGVAVAVTVTVTGRVATGMVATGKVAVGVWRTRRLISPQPRFCWRKAKMSATAQPLSWLSP